MNNRVIGFSKEYEKLSGMANVGVDVLRGLRRLTGPLKGSSSTGIRGGLARAIVRLRKSKGYTGAIARNQHKAEMASPFSESREWKKVKPWQKARTIAGISANTVIAGSTIPMFMHGSKNGDSIPISGT